MKKFRLSIALLLLALVLAIVPAVLAQDTTLGASQGDYDLWTSANAATAAFSTVTYDFSAKLEVTGMQDSNVSADLKGTGVIDSNKDKPAFQLDVTGNVVQGKTTQAVNLGVRIIDGVIYYNDGSGWKGEQLDNVASSLKNGLGSSGLPINPADLQSGDLSSLSSNPEAAAAMQALSQLKPEDFLSLVRADNGGVAQFTLKVDVAKLLASPALTSMFSGLAAMGSSSSGGAAATAPAMTDAQMQQMQAMIGGMFSTATVTVDQYVDTASKMVQRTVLTIALPLDAMVGPGAAVNLSFDVNLSKYNEAITVEAPADAVMMTPEPSSTQ